MTMITVNIITSIVIASLVFNERMIISSISFISDENLRCLMERGRLVAENGPGGDGVMGP